MLVHKRGKAHVPSGTVFPLSYRHSQSPCWISKVGRKEQRGAMAVVAWLLAIGTVWGTTNALIKRGALIAEEQSKSKHSSTTALSSSSSSSTTAVVGRFFGDWIRLLCVWQYSVPFLLNLCMSVLFVLKLGDSPITLAVPVTNATTFAVTAVAGAALGENLRPLETIIGVALIIAGVTLCISPPIKLPINRLVVT